MRGSLKDLKRIKKGEISMKSTKSMKFEQLCTVITENCNAEQMQELCSHFPANLYEKIIRGPYGV